MTTLRELFDDARLLADTRAGYARFFDALTVAGASVCYGTLATSRDSTRWTATIYILYNPRIFAVSFQGHGATERDALDDTERYAQEWAEKEMQP